MNKYARPLDPTWSNMHIYKMKRSLDTITSFPQTSYGKWKKIQNMNFILAMVQMYSK